MGHFRKYQWIGLLVMLLALPLLTAPIGARPAVLESRSVEMTPDTIVWLEQAIPTDTTTFIVLLKDVDSLQVQVSQAQVVADRRARRARVVQLLSEQAQRNEQAVRGFLNGQGIAQFADNLQFYAIINGFAITTNSQVVNALSRWDRVARITKEPIVTLQQPLPGTVLPRVNAVEWNIAKIGADRTWTELGIDGTGALVGSVDTGVRYTHEALRDNYKCAGMNDHSACWKDAGGGNATTPVDRNGHGTHTVGSAVGKLGIGVAPGAKWIACTPVTPSGGSPAQGFLNCMDWMLKPGGNPANAPDVVINSWTVSDPAFQQAVTNWVNAGIFPEFSIGNSGPGCNSTVPPGNFANAFGVGATDSSDRIANFSSRGPGPSGRLKPEVSAPGASIRSADRGSDTAYSSKSGTSMSGPHAAGLVALLLQANPNLTIDQLSKLIKDNAFGISSNECSSTGIPNNVYGYGRIDAYKTIKAAKENQPTATPVTPTPTPVTPTRTPVTPTRTPVTPTPTPTPVNPTVSIIDFAFEPADLTINLGETVTWKNNGARPHDATSNDGSWRTDTLNPGQSGSVTFRTAGTFPYYCSIHPNMRGNIIVRDTLFSDNFESDKGWAVNPDGTDTASSGRWERGDPEGTFYDQPSLALVPIQLDATTSGSNDLVTGRLAGSRAGANDLDGGVTSIRSPSITLPSGSNPKLAFSYYLAHANNASSADYIRVKVVGNSSTTVFEKLGTSITTRGAWQTVTVDLNAYAGQTVRLLIEAADAGTASLLEAAVDDVVVTGNVGGSTPTPMTPTSTPTPVTPTSTPDPGGVVFRDDFESDKGWAINPEGRDTATGGKWERGDPEATSYEKPSLELVALQLGTTTSGSNDLVTGRLAGSSAGTYDIDGGVSSIQSPAIGLPGHSDLTLSLSYYLAHLNNASSDDYLRVKIIEIPTSGVGQSSIVFEKRGQATTVPGAWMSTSIDLSAYAGKTVHIVIEAADAGTASLVEAAVDDVVISSGPPTRR